ncbi:MAG: C45 family autoproteolytic acyltransferase/hydrolase [Planctomycetota bacterium]|jgi:tetratricopeptide (TPR) repeat protein
MRPESRRRLVRAGKIAGAVLVSLVLLLVLTSKIIDWVCIADEPEIAELPPIVNEEPRREGGRTVLGRSWLAERRGIRMMSLEGDPFTIGVSNSKMTGDLIAVLEKSLVDTVERLVPSYTKRWLLGKLVLVRNRRLPEFVSDEVELEILGLSRGYTDHYPGIATLYHRLLNYHAAHDISHAVMDSPLVGCTSFAAVGKHTADGRLIVGRNFDFEAGRSFDELKLVLRVRPDERYAFVSVAWPGMLGVVTGMNEERIYVSLNAGHSSDDVTIGTPVSLVAREILQRASSLDEAVRIAREAKVFVSESLLIADGEEGTAAVVEKSPSRAAVRTMEGGSIVCANHFLTDTFADDPGNLDYVRTGTSVARFERMRSLVEDASGGLDVPRAVGILRDRCGAEGRDIGLGNRSAVNPLICTHSVVADVTAGVIWVSAPPHQLGEFVPFDVRDFEAYDEGAVVAADPLLAEGGNEKSVCSHRLRRRAAEALDEQRLDEAERALEEAEALNPRFFEVHLLWGRLELARGRSGDAVGRLEKALELQPPFLRDRTSIEATLREAKGLADAR